jgi:hypothetical protein
VTAELRILTVKWPWSMAIMRLGKDVENRSRNVAGEYRGPIAIHSSGTQLRVADELAASKRIGQISNWVPLWPLDGALGHIQGVVDVVDVHASDRCWDGPANPGLLCSDWSDDDATHVVLANPRPLAEPIPYKGALGLRRLPDDIAAAVWAGVAA